MFSLSLIINLIINDRDVKIYQYTLTQKDANTVKKCFLQNNV